jgi:predicted Zn-dependent protease
MERRHARWIPILIAVAIIGFKFLTAERFVNPETGRVARVGLSQEQEAALGLQSFRQVLSESRVIESGPEVDMVRRVAQRLVRVVDESARHFEWSVAVVRSDQVNAFCLPGGKIVVFTGILPVAKNDAGLATVMGHEIAHATSRHGAQRVFKQDALQIAMQGAAVSMADMDYDQRRLLLGALGAGAQYGVVLPFSRDDELEADEIGLMYMARAGYDPRESVAFWERMAESMRGQKPPEFMSTHPGDATRIERLGRLMPRAMEEYRKGEGRGEKREAGSANRE